jgi:DNA-binding MarR family transcriptional regulator
MTATVSDVLSLLAAATPDCPEWGLSVCKKTGYGTGTVYPALERLLEAGLITSFWEEPQPADRPRRRYFEVTDAGLAALWREWREWDERRRRIPAWTPASSGPVGSLP